MKIWPRVPLGELCVEKTGTVDPTQLGDRTFLYVDIGSVDVAKKEITEARRLAGHEAPSRARRSLLEGDVIVSMTRPNLNAVAFIGPALSGQICSTGFSVLRPGPRLDAAFLFHFVQTSRFVQKLSALTAGALYPAVSEGQVRQQAIPLPPLDEQRRIADILGRAASIRRLRRQAQDTARLIIPALFNKMFGDAVQNPMNWPMREFGEVGQVQLGRQRAPKYQSGDFTRPYVRVANIHEDRIDVSDLLSMDFNQKDFAQYQLSSGDILLNEGQSAELVGRPAMWGSEVENCCFQNTLVRFRPNAKFMRNEFAFSLILQYYREGVLRSISSQTSNVAHLGAGRFAKLTAMCPPLELQDRFVDFYKRFREAAGLHNSATALADISVSSLQSRLFG